MLQISYSNQRSLFLPSLWIMEIHKIQFLFLFFIFYFFFNFLIFLLTFNIKIYITIPIFKDLYPLICIQPYLCNFPALLSIMVILSIFFAKKAPVFNHKITKIFKLILFVNNWHIHDNFVSLESLLNRWINSFKLFNNNAASKLFS